MAKHSLFSKALASLGLFAFASFIQSAGACTGVYVGPKCSASGNVMIARSADSDKFQRHLEIVPAGKGRSRVITDMCGFSYTLPAKTYKYVGVPYGDISDVGRYDSAVTNECGLAISATVTGYNCDAVKAADPNVPDGIGELTLPTILGSCCSSAREAVELTARIVDEYGSCEQNIVMVADRNEAWYIEIYSGHQYCAVRMPDDCVAAFGNEFMLASVDPESEGVICSKGLFSIPEKNGFAVYDADGGMNLSRTYMGEGRYFAFSHMRTWRGHQLLSPSTVGDYDAKAAYPLFFKPEGQVSLQDVFAIFRDRYEGTPYCPETNPSPDIRCIGDEGQGMVHVLEVYPDLPAEMACVTWLTLTEAAFAPFVPISNAIKSCNPVYGQDMKAFRYDAEAASIVYKRLNALSAQNRELYGANVRKYWEMVESDLVSEFPARLRELAGGRRPVKKITKYCTSLQDAAIADAHRIFDELCWYLMQNNYTYRFIFDFNKPLDPEPLAVIPFEPMFDIASFAARKGWERAAADGGLKLSRNGITLSLTPSNGHRTDPGEISVLNADGSTTKIAARVEDAGGRIMVPISVLGFLK